MRVLVGFDGSAEARDAVELARWLAAGEPGEALLVYVLPHPGALPVAYYLLGAEESPWERGFFADAAAALAPLEVRWKSYVGGSPAHVLTDAAAEEGAELIVLGSPHRGAVGRALLGSVAEGVLHGAPAPVLVAPRGYAERRRAELRTVAVAYDGSEEAKVALVWAESLARRRGAALELLTVATVSTEAATFVAGFPPAPAPQPGEVLDAGLASLGAEVAAAGRVLHGGSVASALAGASEAADLLVAGSRGYGVLGRVMAGSVSTALLSSASCPVLVVPRPD